MKKKIILLITIITLSSCSNKIHVITEMDGDREIRWYTTKEKK